MKKVELPIGEPIYGTFNYQLCSSLICENPTIKNWYLNNVMNLICSKGFLYGRTTPDLRVEKTSWIDNPCFDKKGYSMEFSEGYINHIIRNLIDSGYYVYFSGVDDYYVDGKSWCRERHFIHDGVICGYDQEKKTYSIYAYNSDWMLKKFETPQRSFNQGRCAAIKKGEKGYICGMKANADEVKLEPEIIIGKIHKYLDSSLRKFPYKAKEDAEGIVVHDYIALYISKLIEGAVPYERTDTRIMRTLWEQKKVMYERLVKAEEALSLDSRLSSEYEKVVPDADRIRMLYASHCIKRRDSSLPFIRKKLIDIKDTEKRILSEFIRKAERVI